MDMARDRERNLIWSVAVVKPRTQFKIKENYNNFFRDDIGEVEFYIPFKTGSNNRKYIYISKYLFVRMQEPDKYYLWSKLEYNILYFIVKKISDDSSTILTIQPEEFEKFKENIELKLQKKEDIVGFSCLVKRGAFAGHYGVIKAVKNDRVKIEVDFMSRVSLWIKRSYIDIMLS